jgi:hypothetical protein
MTQYDSNSTLLNFRSFGQPHISVLFTELEHICVHFVFCGLATSVSQAEVEDRPGMLTSGSSQIIHFQMIRAVISSLGNMIRPWASFISR